MRGDPKTDIELRSLIWGMFGESADEDYLVARSAMKLNLHFQFAWSAQQAIEKYMKCALLMNAVSVTRFSHDLGGMFDELSRVSGSLLPALLIPSRRFPLRGGIVRKIEPLRDFILRIEQIGHPNNRYRVYSIYLDRFDLHKLDETCFQMRRLCIPLDMIYLEPLTTFREALQGDPNLQIHKLYFKGGSAWREAEDPMETLKDRNFSFFPEDFYGVNSITAGSAFYNSPLFLAIENLERYRAALRWLIDNARFSRDDRNFILEKLGEN